MATDKMRVAELQARHRARNLQRMLEYLADNPCVDCGESDPVVLDFDHLPGERKRFEIGRAMSGSTRSWAAILLEIKKCEVVCANCHRRRTAKRGSFMKLDTETQLAARLDLAPRLRYTVDHGQGAKGKRNCPCELCRERRRQYQRERRS